MPRLSSARAAVRPPIPAPAIRTFKPPLLDRCDASLRDHVVLRAGSAGHADRTDDLAVHDDRVSAARRDDAIERCQIAEERTPAEQPLKGERRATERGCRLRLVLRDGYGGVLAVVHLDEIHQVAA